MYFVKMQLEQLKLRQFVFVASGTFRGGGGDTKFCTMTVLIAYCANSSPGNSVAIFLSIKTNVECSFVPIYFKG